MATDAPAVPAAATPSRAGQVRAIAYIGTVAALGLGLTAAAVIVDGVELDTTLAVLGMLAVLTWWSGPIVVEDRVRLSFSSIVLLAAMGLVGPAGAGLVGIMLGPLQRGSVPLRARVFNTGMSATLGVLGATAYLAAGGRHDSSGLLGAWEILRGIGLPILLADLVQVAANLLLLTGVLRVVRRVPMRAQMAQLVRTSGAGYLGYGIIAFLLIVLWQPGELGPASIVLVLAPLLVARWAYLQYAEEFKAHERALHVLVAAVETKAPHLVGHSARVAELSAHMAEHLGLRSHAVADIRKAGMLHDLGQTTLPTALVRGGEAAGGDLVRSYPARGVEVLRDLSFLAGSLDAIAHHREPAAHRAGGDPAGLPARIVGIADEYDLVTEVGTPDGARLRPEEALRRLGETGPASADLLRALEHAVSRTSGVAS